MCRSVGPHAEGAAVPDRDASMSRRSACVCLCHHGALPGPALSERTPHWQLQQPHEALKLEATPDGTVYRVALQNGRAFPQKFTP